MDALLKIQAELKAPKGQFNAFGKYNYRSCEDILEAVKPLLAKHGATLTISDDLQETASGVFVKATATIKAENKIEWACAFARHSVDKKGDDSQITGAVSSYARKYALNGLFCIDDTKDLDGFNTHGKDEPQTQQPQQGHTPRGGHAPSNRQSHAPRQNQQPPQPSARKPTMLEHMQQFGVTREMLEAAIGAPYEKFTDDDKRLLLKTLKLVKGGMPFADAIVEAQN